MKKTIKKNNTKKHIELRGIKLKLNGILSEYYISVIADVIIYATKSNNYGSKYTTKNTLMNFNFGKICPVSFSKNDFLKQCTVIRNAIDYALNFLNLTTVKYNLHYCYLEK